MGKQMSKRPGAARAILTAAALTLAAALSGCTAMPNNETNISAMEELAKTPMPGFKISNIDRGDSVCVPMSYCSGAATVIFTATEPFDSRAEFCNALIEWAPNVGADSWSFNPEYQAMPLKDHEGAAKYSCTGGSLSALIGSTNDVRWMLEGGPEVFQVMTVSDGTAEVEDRNLLARTWDLAIASLSPGTRTNMKALDSIETYRLANPDADPSSKKTIERALNDVKLPEGSKLVEDKAGKIHYLYIPQDEFLMERCINVTPFDAEYFQMENPGSGFFILPLVDGEEVIDEFGYTSFSTCPMP